MTSAIDQEDGLEGNPQTSKDEYTNDRQLPGRFHLQTYQPRYRQHQDGNICYNVRRSDSVRQVVLVDAMTSLDTLVPEIANWATAEDDSKDQGNAPTYHDDTGDD